MLKTEHFFALLVLSFVSCDVREIVCPESTRPHKTECNKYFKCIKLPSNSLSWVTLTCQEGLIYDKNLRSCAIPSDDWDCNLSGEELEENDDGNVYGVKNLDPSEDAMRDQSDEFLEVIDGDMDLELNDEKSRMDDSNEDTTDYSGDGSEQSFVTTSSPTMRMVTTQVQRLTQLLQNLPKTNNEITADDLNTYLATQKIQSKSPDYQKTNFNSDDKTTVPADGKVHPDIESEIINMQNDLKMRLTTLSMDETTPPTSIKPIFYVNKEPITEIKLKAGDGLDGVGSHQIVVNRPEGSVLFNVPVATHENSKNTSPFLSEDILKTILEISKQMVSKSSSNNQESHQPAHPLYYAVPIPIIPPQNHVQNYYGTFSNQSTATTESPLVLQEEVSTKPPKKRKKINKNENRINLHPQLYQQQQQQQQNNLKGHDSFNDFTSYGNPQQSSNQYSTAPENNLKIYHNFNQQQPQYQYPVNYYSPYTNHYTQNYQHPYNAMPYYQQYTGNDRYNTQNSPNQFSNYNGAYYGNRPFVSDSSAPFSYPIQQNPYQKESFSSSSYENDEYDAFQEESDDDNEKFDDIDSASEESDDEKPEKSPTDGLICTIALARQANKTDCFKYYVCNAKTKEVLSYTCPAFTAFNDATKFCDSAMYKSCKKSQDSVAGALKNNKIFAEAQKALQQAKRESQKAERIANLVKKQSQRIIYDRNQAAALDKNDVYEDESEILNEPPPRIIQRPIAVQQKPKLTYKARPKVTKKIKSQVQKSSIRRRTKKKKVKCIAPGNIEDPEDKFSYWHCFKSSDGRMKRIHKKCSSNLRFCAATTYCSSNC